MGFASPELSPNLYFDGRQPRPLLNPIINDSKYRSCSSDASLERNTSLSFASAAKMGIIQSYIHFVCSVQRKITHDLLGMHGNSGNDVQTDSWTKISSMLYMYILYIITQVLFRPKLVIRCFCSGQLLSLYPLLQSHWFSLVYNLINTVNHNCLN